MQHSQYHASGANNRFARVTNLFPCVTWKLMPACSSAGSTAKGCPGDPNSLPCHGAEGDT